MSNDEIETIVHDPRRFAVIGIGPCGGILASHLNGSVGRLAAVEINEEARLSMAAEGIQITGLRNLSTPVDEIIASASDLADFDPDVVIISTKTWTLPGIVEDLGRFHRKGRVYVVAQNGIDNERLLVDRFGPESTVRMVINFAGLPLAPGVHRMTFFNPPNMVGGAPEAAQAATEFAELLTKVDLETVYATNLRKHIWKKGAMNASMGAISALTRQDMRSVLQCEGTRSFLRRILREAAAVANGEGQDFSEDFVQSCIEYMARAGRHKPSMLQDVEAGRPTEVDTLNWRIVELGRQVGVRTPYNEGLGVLIHAIESESKVCYGFRIGSVFNHEDGTQVCGYCPYEHGHTAVRGAAVVSADQG